jgi:hypothetical protein
MAGPLNERRDEGGAIDAGAVAGALAGIAMLLTAMAASAAVGLGFWLPLQLIGGATAGVRALLGGWSILVAALAVHFGVSALWGAVFGAATRGRLLRLPAALAGLAYGVLVFAVMHLAVLPWANPVMHDRVKLTLGAWLGAHAVWGIALALLLPVMRAYRARQLQLQSRGWA